MKHMKKQEGGWAISALKAGLEIDYKLEGCSWFTYFSCMLPGILHLLYTGSSALWSIVSDVKNLSYPLNYKFNIQIDIC